MNEDRVDRIIQHSRAGAGNDLNSPAVFSESLARPLINNPSEWDVLINKFKIDTFSIPITIVKLREYQPVRTDGRYLTDYNVQVIHNGYVYTAPCYFKPEHQTPDSNPPVVSTREDGQVKYDNTHENFFEYSIEHFLEMINTAIKDAFSDANLSNPTNFEYDPVTQLISVQYPTEFSKQMISILRKTLYFSPNLWEFIGKGFRIDWGTYGDIGKAFEHVLPDPLMI